MTGINCKRRKEIRFAVEEKQPEIIGMGIMIRIFSVGDIVKERLLGDVIFKMRIWLKLYMKNGFPSESLR